MNALATVNVQTAPVSRQNLIKAVLRTDLTAFIEKAFHTINPGSVYLPNWHEHHNLSVRDGAR